MQASITTELPSVAIIGRPNVGKSTLFNRILQRRQSIVDEQPGVTRDRVYSEVDWAGRDFVLIDTGGLVENPDTELEEKVIEQAMAAVEQAEVIVFVTEMTPTPLDKEVANLLRKQDKPVILAANKVDNTQRENFTYELFSLGLGEPTAISATHGRNVGELLDRIVDSFPLTKTEEETEAPVDLIKVAVMGKPNVGKSSFVNFIGGDVAIVHDEPGTTRDAVDLRFQYDDKTQFQLTDTAGLKHHQHGLNYYGSLRSMNALKRSDLALFMVDATKQFTKHDKRIAGRILELNKGMVIVFNKWDLIEEEGEEIEEKYIARARHNAPFLDFVPIIFISAKTGKRIMNSLGWLKEVFFESRKQYKTSFFNELIKEWMDEYPPPGSFQKEKQITYGFQEDVAPPTFAFICKEPSAISYSYKNYLENKIRENLGFFGTPVKLKFKKDNE